MSDLIVVPVTLEDRIAVAQAVRELNSIQHIKYMSRSMLVNSSGVGDTKLRAVLQSMVDDGEIEQLRLTDNPKLQRYYYILTEDGRKLLEEQEEN